MDFVLQSMGLNRVGHDQATEQPQNIHNIKFTILVMLSVWFSSIGTSLVAQMVKRLPTMRETRVQSLGQEDPLEKEMATHSSTLAWKIPWMEGGAW